MEPIGDSRDSMLSSVATARTSEVDLELIVRFVSGDREAFVEVFDRFHRDLHLVVRRFFRGAFDQEEALQEIWLKLYRMRDRFDINRSAGFGPWLRQVARNRCIDLLKERGRSHEIPVAETEARCEASQLSSVHDAYTRRVLSDFLARLDGEQRRFFELCYVQELPHEEIAAALGISVRRSKYLKKKLLARLLRSSALRGAREG
jgi:RNA polymerase sigma factor (sigma-70 family)